MANSRPIRVGLDFDGVVAYNPFRVVRAPVKWVKRTFLKQKSVKFLIPHTPLQRYLWTLMHESSIFPAKGIDLLKVLAKDPRYEFYLITARYSFLKDQLHTWLQRNNLIDIFKGIYSNMGDEQPHLFKARMAKELKLDVFIEDNWDIVSHVSKTTQTRVGWIYNFFDRNQVYEDKYPYLERALQEMLL